MIRGSSATISILDETDQWVTVGLVRTAAVFTMTDPPAETMADTTNFASPDRQWVTIEHPPRPAPPAPRNRHERRRAAALARRTTSLP